MKNHIVFESNDNEIIDNRLESTTTYLSLDKETQEFTQKEVKGYVEPYTIDKITTSDMKAFTVNKDDVILFKYSDDMLQDEIVQVRDALQAEFPDNKVLGLTDNVELLVQSGQEAVDMLNRMIAHIKILN